MRPAASAAVSVTVSWLTGRATGGSEEAERPMLRAARAIEPGSSRASGGVVMARGSAKWSKAARIAILHRFELPVYGLGSVRRQVGEGRGGRGIASAICAASPCPFGGISCTVTAP